MTRTPEDQQKVDRAWYGVNWFEAQLWQDRESWVVHHAQILLRDARTAPVPPELVARARKVVFG